jgi:hypothetical protein
MNQRINTLTMNGYFPPTAPLSMPILIGGWSSLLLSTNDNPWGIEPRQTVQIAVGTNAFCVDSGGAYLISIPNNPWGLAAQQTVSISLGTSPFGIDAQRAQLLSPDNNAFGIDPNQTTLYY